MYHPGYALIFNRIIKRKIKLKDSGNCSQTRPSCKSPIDKLDKKKKKKKMAKLFKMHHP